MDDIKFALLGDRDAARRLTDAGVLIPCPGCGGEHNRCGWHFGELWVELEPWYFSPGEVQDVEEICYVCDECKHYDGDFRKRCRWKPACSKHRLPRKYNVQIQKAAELEAQRRRASLQIVKGMR